MLIDGVVATFDQVTPTTTISLTGRFMKVVARLVKTVAVNFNFEVVQFDLKIIRFFGGFPLIKCEFGMLIALVFIANLRCVDELVLWYCYRLMKWCGVEVVVVV